MILPSILLGVALTVLAYRIISAIEDKRIRAAILKQIAEEKANRPK